MDLAVEDVEVGLVVDGQGILVCIDSVSCIAHFAQGTEFSLELGNCEARCLGVGEDGLADLVGNFVESEGQEEVGHLCGPASGGRGGWVGGHGHARSSEEVDIVDIGGHSHILGEKLLVEAAKGSVLNGVEHHQSSPYSPPFLPLDGAQEESLWVDMTSH